MQIKPRERLHPLQSGPWLDVEGVEAHLLVVLGGVGMAGGWVVGDEQQAAAEEVDGKGSPVKDWWWGVGF